MTNFKHFKIRSHIEFEIQVSVCLSFSLQMEAGPTGELSLKLYRACASHYGRKSITKTCMSPEGEEEWKKLIARPGFKPYLKLMYNRTDKGFRPVLSGYITGDDAVVNRGIDLRYGYDPSSESIKGVVGFGEPSSWALGFPDENGLYGVHGGVFHSVLDEVTAEAGKYLKSPRILTSTISVRVFLFVVCFVHRESSDSFLGR